MDTKYEKNEAIAAEKQEVADEKKETIAGAKSNEIAAEKNKAVADDDRHHAFDDYVDCFGVDTPVFYENTGIHYCPPELFFQRLRASNVFLAFGESVQSGSMEFFKKIIQNHSFTNILVLLCVKYSENNEQYNDNMMLPFLDNFVLGTEIDFEGFSLQYALDDTHQAVLQSAILRMMVMFADAGRDMEIPAYMVANSISRTYESGLWGDRIFHFLYRLIKSPKSIQDLMAGLTCVTALAALAMMREDKKLATAISKTKICDAVFRREEDEYSSIKIIQKEMASCAWALHNMTRPPQPLVIKSGKELALGKK